LFKIAVHWFPCDISIYICILTELIHWRRNFGRRKGQGEALTRAALIQIASEVSDEKLFSGFQSRSRSHTKDFMVAIGSGRDRAWSGWRKRSQGGGWIGLVSHGMF
jgi:hypothetical protein